MNVFYSIRFAHLRSLTVTVDMNPDYPSSFITVGMVGQVDTIHVTVSTCPSASAFDKH